MICNKCNHKLLDDSEFCQYCGNKIEKSDVAVAVEEPEKSKVPVVVANTLVASSVVEDDPSDNEASSNEVLNTILQIQAQNTVEAMKANSETQPNNESDPDFGLVPEKPIFTLALMSVTGEKEYLNHLYTISGEKIAYTRRGSMSVDGINGMIDIYETFLPNGQPYKTIYTNMYGAKESTKAPDGFVLNHSMTQAKAKPRKEKTIKTKYCSRCGSVIDNKTKTCTGCGKQYFRGFRFNKISVVIIISLFSIVTLSTLCVFQYLNTQTLISDSKAEISRLEQQVKSKDSTIKQLEDEIGGLKDEISDLEFDSIIDNWALDFYEEYAVIVNEYSNIYHKYGCDDLDESYFWIYNIDLAEQKGYYACPKCH